MTNLNSVEYLEKIKIKIFENLKDTTFAPSVSPLDEVIGSLAMDDEDEDRLADIDEDEGMDRLYVSPTSFLSTSISH